MRITMSSSAAEEGRRDRSSEDRDCVVGNTLLRKDGPANAYECVRGDEEEELGWLLILMLVANLLSSSSSSPPSSEQHSNVTSSYGRARAAPLPVGPQSSLHAGLMSNDIRNNNNNNMEDTKVMRKSSSFSSFTVTQAADPTGVYSPLSIKFDPRKLSSADEDEAAAYGSNFPRPASYAAFQTVRKTAL